MTQGHFKYIYVFWVLWPNLVFHICFIFLHLHVTLPFATSADAVLNSGVLPFTVHWWVAANNFLEVKKSIIKIFHWLSKARFWVRAQGILSLRQDNFLCISCLEILKEGSVSLASTSEKWVFTVILLHRMLSTFIIGITEVSFFSPLCKQSEFAVRCHDCGRRHGDPCSPSGAGSL